MASDYEKAKIRAVDDQELNHGHDYDGDKNEDKDTRKNYNKIDNEYTNKNDELPPWRKESVEDAASFCKHVSFSWVFPFFWRAVERGSDLDFDDLDITRKIEQPKEYLKTVKEMFFIDESGKCSVSLRRALLGLIGKDMLGSMTLINIAVLFGLVNPFMIAIIVRACTLVSVESVPGSNSTSTDMEYDLSIAAGIGAALVLGSTGISTIVVAQIAWHVGCRCARGAYIAVSSLLYEKPSLMTNTEMSTFSEGEIVNLMAIDCQTVFQVVVLFNLFAILPAIVIGSLGLLLYALGWPVLILFLVLLANTFAVDFISKAVTKAQNEKNSFSDQRSIRMNESLQGIRTVKLNAWEEFVRQRIMYFRKKEAIQLWRIAALRSLQFFMANAVPLLSMVATFMLYRYAVDDNLTVETVFFSVPLFIQLSFGLVFIPNMLNEYRRYRVSVDRLESFLARREDYRRRIVESSDGSVVLQDTSLTWKSMEERGGIQENIPNNEPSKTTNANDVVMDIDPNEKTTNNVLEHMDLSIQPGELIAIVGQVACGKTTLVNGILNLVETSSGKIAVNGHTAYVAQNAFVMNATVRENICFGTAYDQSRYNEVLHACCLVRDLEIFREGDQTEVGEKGVTISGGQRQRIALSRAAYSDKNIIVFDDCLSAMDAHVGETCFEECIMRLLKGKTRILVTNQLNFAERCDRIVVLEDGTIKEVGTYEELNSNAKSFFRSLVEHQCGNDTEENKETTDNDNIETILDAKYDREHEDVAISGTPNGNDDKSGDNLSAVLPTNVKDRKDSQSSAALMTKENKGKGRIGLKDFIYLAREAGTFWLLLIMGCLLFVVPGLQYAVVYLVGEWSSKGALTDIESITPLLILSVCFSISTALLSLTLNRFFMDSANNLHDQMLENVFASPSSWFDTTPVGRILQRFSGDIMAIDIMLPRIMEMWYDNFGQVLVGIIPAAIILPPFLLIVIPVLLFFVKGYRYYGQIILECQRLAMVSIGPVLSSFSTFLQGLDTIRAFDQVSYFIQGFYENNEKFCRTMYCQFNIDRLFIIYMTGFVVSGFIFLLGVLLVTLRETKFVTPEIAGLLLAYAVSLSFRIFGLFFTTAQVERLMASSQRCIEFLYLEAQPDTTVDACGFSDTDNLNWPANGDITFRAVEMQYRPELPKVLHGVTFEIKSGEKAALVGRSGCGKSSIVLTLFRMVEINEGRIEIGGRDIGSIKLATLRKRIGMIPQDSWLFAGTLRLNLDVNGEYSDKEIWKALELVNLKETVLGFPDALDHQVEEKGDNLSGGTVQLLCLARVLLKQPKIIVMDEATSSVDLVTDSIVQKTIRSSFSNCTLVTIAHRLHTIIDFDKIIAIDEGRVAEIGSPYQLLTEKPDGIFSCLVKATGESSAKELLSRSMRNLVKSTTDSIINNQ